MEIRNADKLIVKISELVKNLKEIEDGITDISYIDWVKPSNLLPLVVAANTKNLKLTYAGKSAEIRAYLRAIGFPTGTLPTGSRIKKGLLPITKLPCEDVRLLTAYEEKVLKCVAEKYRSNFLQTLKYSTSELLANIKEHAKIDSYWIFAQCWSKNICEICIADAGIGYKKSYEGTRFAATTHEMAIVNAMDGKSSKSDTERGTGLRSIIKLVTESNGEIGIMSGDAFISITKNKIVPFRLPLQWKGSLISLKLELKNIGNFYDCLRNI